MSSSVMDGDKEKQLQPTGGQYRYQSTETEEATDNISSCYKEHESRMER